MATETSGGLSWQRIEAVLAAAFDTPPEQRDDYLQQACAGDPALRSEVESLLQAEAGGPLDNSVASFVEALLVNEHGDSLDPAAADAEEDLNGLELGPYRLLRPIGVGGMGEVYEAVDTRLERRVALKLLHPGWHRHPEARQRLMVEARAVSALDHPNICTLHDLGESRGRTYLVFAHYEGQTLEQRIANGPIPVAEAREIAIGVAQGLEAAHEAGITHRDIKPSNVMLTKQGLVKILDFGIAKVAGESALTQAGSSPGTPVYMSPEQLAGDAVDRRTDVWSWGVLLYEMLAGQRPFAISKDRLAILSIVKHQPEPLSELREGTPPALELIAYKALAKDPGERYQSFSEVLSELGDGVAPRQNERPGQYRQLVRLALLAALFLVLAIAWWRLGSRRGIAEKPVAFEEPVVVQRAVAPVPVVGVVPFRNRTGDRALDWYGEGVAQLVADNLVQSRHLQVVSALRIASLREAADPQDLARRANALGIEALLSGELLRGPEGLSLTARLDAVGEGRSMASWRRDGLSADDLLRAADSVAQRARKGLQVPANESVDVFAADFASRNSAAYERYIAGLEAFLGYRNAEAEVAFVAALEAAPDFTMARYRLAHLQAADSRTDEALVSIRQAVSELSRLSDREARYVRAAEANFSRRVDEAIAAYRELIEHYPYETEARYFLALLLYHAGRYEEELEVLQVLARLEPENHVTWSLAGSANLALGRFNQAILDLQRYTSLEPNSANGFHLLGDAYRAQGELDLAAEQYTAALSVDSSFHYAKVALAVVDVLRGRVAAAESRLLELVEQTALPPRHRIDAGFELAALYRSRGRFAAAGKVLQSLAEPIAVEAVREAMALSIRGTCLLEQGRLQPAQALIDRAVQRSPGVATRYLFARAQLELHADRPEAFDRTLVELMRGALPPENPDRTEEKAVAYLRGLRWLAAANSDKAIGELSRAVALDGYEYNSYRLALARAYLSAGRLQEAMSAAREVATEQHLEQPRLDLELDRNRALLLLAQVQLAMGRTAEAAEQAQAFLARWADADPDLPDLLQARQLARPDQ